MAKNKTDIILRFHDGRLKIFQDVSLWKTYTFKDGVKKEGKRLEINYKKSSVPKTFKIADIFKFILINDTTTIVEEYKKL